ncbi:MAG: hypothetical protein ACOYEK_04635 [bacterium]|jgi:hypothetical protein
MGYENITLLLLRAIPEAIGIIGAGTVLVGKRIPPLHVVLAGLLGGIAVWIFRLLPLNFGIHSILSIMVFIVIQRLILKLNLKMAITGTLLGFALLGLMEYISILIISAVFDMAYSNLIDDKLLYFFLGLPSLLGIVLFWLCGWRLLKNR